MPNYRVINAETGRPVVRDHLPVEFPDGALAAAFLKQLRDSGDSRPLKVEPVATEADNREWQTREQARLDTGEYTPVPFRNSVFYQAALGVHRKTTLEPSSYAYLVPIVDVARHHYAHVSKTDSTKLAYTESPAKGLRDIQTTLKPGTYLQKYFGGVLSLSDIETLVRDWQRRYSTVDVLFARTPDEIVKVYRSGPRSCMSGAASDYSSGSHPCIAYGAPSSDLTVAYIQNGPRISARCLVWESAKRYSRIYGDDTLLRRELESRGFCRAPFYGAKLAKIKVGKTYIMPYIDDAGLVQEEEDHFVLVEKKTKGKQVYGCHYTNGLAEPLPYVVCTVCGEEVAPGHIHTYGADTYCQTCYFARFKECQVTRTYEPADSFVEVRARLRGAGWVVDNWSAAACLAQGFQCDVTGLWYSALYRVYAANGRSISPDAISAGHYLECKATNRYFPRSEMVQLTDGTFVSREWAMASPRRRTRIAQLELPLLEPGKE